jgi:hypothetical protein
MSVLCIWVVFNHDVKRCVFILIGGAKRHINFSHFTILAHFYLLPIDNH